MPGHPLEVCSNLAVDGVISPWTEVLLGTVGVEGGTEEALGLRLRLSDRLQKIVVGAVDFGSNIEPSPDNMRHRLILPLTT